jgi:hypothetical protein
VEYVAEMVMYAARGMASVGGQNWSTETAAVISAGMIITYCKDGQLKACGI